MLAIRETFHTHPFQIATGPKRSYVLAAYMNARRYLKPEDSHGPSLAVPFFHLRAIGDESPLTPATKPNLPPSQEDLDRGAVLRLAPSVNKELKEKTNVPIPTWGWGGYIGQQFLSRQRAWVAARQANAAVPGASIPFVSSAGRLDGPGAFHSTITAEHNGTPETVVLRNIDIGLRDTEFTPTAHVFTFNKRLRFTTDFNSKFFKSEDIDRYLEAVARYARAFANDA